ncbi:MAG: hypothetical protein Q8L93_11435 [Rhodocyclaceae bacterium]|nr:hypothetical protein [Rhodocyclaceae bacterium]
MSKWRRPGDLPAVDADAVSPAPTFAGGLPLLAHAAKMKWVGYGG